MESILKNRPALEHEIYQAAEVAGYYRYASADAEGLLLLLQGHAEAYARFGTLADG